MVQQLRHEDRDELETDRITARCSHSAEAVLLLVAFCITFNPETTVPDASDYLDLVLKQNGIFFLVKVLVINLIPYHQLAPTRVGLRLL